MQHNFIIVFMPANLDINCILDISFNLTNFASVALHGTSVIMLVIGLFVLLVMCISSAMVSVQLVRRRNVRSREYWIALNHFSISFKADKCLIIALPFYVRLERFKHDHGLSG